MEALRSIKEVAAIALKGPVEIGTISQPRHFNNSVRQAIVCAAEEVEPLLKQPWQIIEFSNAARLAYDLNSCAGFGLLNEDGCDIDEGPHYIVYVDYQKGHLEFSIADVTECTLDSVDHARFPEYGEDALTGFAYHSNWLAKLQSVFRKDDNSYRPIENTFRTFMAKNQLTSKAPDQLEFLRAIIFSGGASKEAFTSLCLAISAALGDQRDKIRDYIDPFYVGAVGAANRARYQRLNPKILDDIRSTNIVPDHFDDHGEL